MNKRAFTLIELLSVIVLLSILVALAFFSYTKYLKTSRRKVLEIDIKTMESATRNAIDDCNKGTNNAFCNSFVMPDGGETLRVTLKELVDNRYLDEFKNPYNKNTYCDVNNSYVLATRNVSSDKSDISFTYNACLICGNDQDQEKTTMAKIMKKKGISTADITTCTGLSTNQVNNLD